LQVEQICPDVGCRADESGCTAVVASWNWGQQGGLGGGGIKGEVEAEGVGCVAGGVGGYEAKGVDAISEGVAADGFELGATQSEAAAAVEEGGDVGEFGNGSVVETGTEAGYAAAVGDGAADGRMVGDAIAVGCSGIVG